MESINSRWEEIRAGLVQKRAKLNQKIGAKNQLIKVRDQEKINFLEAQDEHSLCHQAYLFLRMEITDRRLSAIKSIEELSSTALQQIYGNGYRLQFETFEEQRKEGAANFKMEIQIISPHEGRELVTGLINERGGGVVEIVSFALRIAALNWMAYDGPLIMDEAYKSMSDDAKIEGVAQFLRDVTNLTARQIIFATHKADVFGKVADNIILVEQVDGVAQCTMINDHTPMTYANDGW